MLHKRVGLIFTLFSAFSLVINVFTPNNPDHNMNVIEQSILPMVFALSYFLPAQSSGVLQIIVLIATAFIPMHLNDSPFFGAVIAVIALLLIYAYDGYKTRALWKLPASFFTLFALCAIARSNFTPPSPEMWVGAFGWSMFISVFCLIVWMIADHRERTRALERGILEDNKRLIAENRRLVQEMKQLVKRCPDDAD